jgi:hypothetical protein
MIFGALEGCLDESPLSHCLERMLYSSLSVAEKHRALGIPGAWPAAEKRRSSPEQVNERQQEPNPPLGVPANLIHISAIVFLAARKRRSD